MALGAQLRKARMTRNESVADVTAATQMLAQTIDAIEQEDFSKMAAPIYARGFIKLYAQHLGLDPRPLLDEYMMRFVTVRAPGSRPIEPVAVAVEKRGAIVKPDPADGAAARADVDPGSSSAWKWVDDLKEAGRETAEAVSRAFAPTPREGEPAASWNEDGPMAPNRPAGWLFKNIPLVLGILLVVIFLVSILSRVIRGSSSSRDEGANREELRMVSEPPEPYAE